MITRIALALCFIAFYSSTSFSQVITATTITSTVDEFGFGCPCVVENLMEDVTASTDENTNFEFETTSGFSTSDIGFVSQLGQDTLTITYDFTGTYDVSKLLVWNAYFSIELDHSSDSIILLFYDDQNNLINTIHKRLALADDNDESGELVDFGTTVMGVARIDLHVKTLHGGNEISLRRLAYIGTPSVASSAEYNLEDITLFPNPANDYFTLKIPSSLQVKASLYNQAGQVINLDAVQNGNLIEYNTAGLSPGIYFIRLSDNTSTLVKKISIH